MTLASERFANCLDTGTRRTLLIRAGELVGDHRRHGIGHFGQSGTARVSSDRADYPPALRVVTACELHSGLTDGRLTPLSLADE